MCGKQDVPQSEKRREGKTRRPACAAVQWYEWVVPAGQRRADSSVSEENGSLTPVRVLLCCTKKR